MKRYLILFEALFLKKKLTTMYCGFYIKNVEVKHMIKIVQQVGGKNLKCKILMLYRK